MLVVKHVARSAEIKQEELESDQKDEDDKIAMAAERVEAYYLPPDDRKTKPVDKIRKPSNIDIPPGSVVTFDGKTVSGTSLTAPILGGGTFEARSSKAAEFLRHSPQFGPFRGEIPPLDHHSINLASLPQLNSQAVINRDLNAPALAPAGAQTTRLAPLRFKRTAHHTPEHTAEQERQFSHHDHSGHDHLQHHDHIDHHNQTSSKNLSNCIRFSTFNIIFATVLVYFTTKLYL